jgi:rhamnosyltransferase subunit B
MKVLLPTLGSAGDIHPFLAIGRAAQARGHEVEVMTNPVFADMVRRAGLKFHPVGTPDHYADAIKSPKLWHPIDGFGVLWRRMARYAIEPVYQRIANHAANGAHGACVVLATPLMFGARLANEKLKVPLVTAYTAATMLRSCENPLTMAHWRVPRWVPKTVRAAAWQALDKWKLEPMVAEDLHRLRPQLGLPAIHQSVFGHWVHSPQAGVTLFPAWFAPAPGDWPQQVKQAGFPLYDGDAVQGLDADLSRFLDAGEPPIVFTPGSAMGHGHDFFRAAVRSCMELGRRGVLLTMDASQIPNDLPPTVHYCAYAPFRLLLPRAAALVHHGGIGNSAQALRAALPQLLTPMGFDQFDNAMRLERLGVAASVKRHDPQYADMAPRLRELLGSARVASACRDAAAKVMHDKALESICNVLETAL